MTRVETAAPPDGPGLPAYRAAIDAYVAGDLAGALTHFAEAVAAEPTLAAAEYGAAMVWMAMGQGPPAWAAIERAVAAAPDEPAWWTERARVALTIGETERGLAAIDDALERGGDPVDLYGLRGSALLYLGDMAQARAAYAEARARGPHRAETHHNAALAAEVDGDLAAAVDGYWATVAIDPTLIAAWANLTRLLVQLDRRDELAEAYGRMHARAPDDEAIAHLWASARGDNPPTAPRAYVTALFDHMAPGFERLMVDELGYCGPALVAAALDAHGPSAVGRALDLGCGTGLCGPVLRSRAAHLVGVDLSPRMIAEATRAGHYDELIVDDAGAHLAGAAPYELVVAADVLIYFGDLASLAAAVAAALAPGGVWVFTVEDAAAPGYALGPDGRYAHHRDHVAAILAAAGLTVLGETAAVVRRQAGRDVAGRVWTARAG